MHRAWNRVSAIQAFVKKKITWKYINEGRPSEKQATTIYLRFLRSSITFLPEETKSGRGVGRLSRGPTVPLEPTALDKLIGVVH